MPIRGIVYSSLTQPSLSGAGRVLSVDSGVPSAGRPDSTWFAARICRSMLHCSVLPQPPHMLVRPAVASRRVRSSPCSGL